MERRLAVVGSILVIFLGMLTAPIIANSATVEDTSRTYFLPKQRHGDARILIDPGIAGLPGGLKLKNVLYPDFRAKFASDSAFLWVTVHPPGVNVGTPPAWKGKRVAFTVGETNLNKAQVDAAVTALSKAVAKREHAWGWMWRKKQKNQNVAADSKAGLTALGKLHRELVFGDKATSTKKILAIVKTHASVGVTLRAARLLYSLGEGATARRIVQPYRTRMATRVAQSKAGDVLKARQVQVLGRVLALLGNAQGAKGAVVQLGKLGEICSGVAIARALAIAGDSLGARDILEHTILSQNRDCHSGQTLLVELFLRAGEKARAKARMKIATRGGPKQIVAHQARLAWDLAYGSAEQVANASYASQIQSPIDPDPFEIAVLGVLLNPPTALQVRLAKERASRVKANYATFLNAATLCVISGDYLCADEYLGKASARKQAQPLLPALKALHALRRGKRADADRWLSQAWELHPEVVLPLWLEVEKLAEGAPEKAAYVARLRERAKVAYGWNLPTKLVFGTKVESATQVTSANPQPGSPGSTSSAYLWYLLGGLGLVGMIVLVLRRRKSQS